MSMLKRFTRNMSIRAGIDKVSIIRRSARHMLMVDREDSHGINIKLQLIEMISTEIIEELESQKRPLTKEESRQATLEAIAQLEETSKKLEEEVKCLKY